MAKKRARPEKHKQSLQEDLEKPETHGVRTKTRASKRQKTPDDEDEGLDVGLSNKVLEQARAQQTELDDTDGNLDWPQGSKRHAHAVPAIAAADSEDEDSDSFSVGGESFMEPEEEEISLEDEAALRAFMGPGAGTQHQQTLADIILAKIEEKQQRGQATSVQGEAQQARALGLDDRVQQVYTGVGKVLSRYTTGKLPKAFKIIPNLSNWEEILWLTQPEQWSSHAVFQGTRLFISNLSARMAQRFLALVLLPHFRNDISTNKRLHHALFQALRKATYKPDAFFKGILLPLCASGDCTLREAIILTSAIKRTSIPVLHSAAALMRLADMPYAGTTSFFIRVLLDKKYALPYRVVDGLVDHFTRFKHEERSMPVVWHQSLLIFVQRYKSEIRKDDKEALRALVKEQYHYQVTPEIHRELEASRSRGEAGPAGKPGQATAKLGLKSQENLKNLAPVFMDED